MYTITPLTSLMRHFIKSALNHPHFYPILTTAYGGIRKAIQVKDAHIVTHDLYTKAGLEEGNNIPLLYVDKAALVLASAGSGMICWPFFLYWDITYLELYLRSLQPTSHGFSAPRSVADLLFR